MGKKVLIIGGVAAGMKTASRCAAGIKMRKLRLLNAENL